MCEVTPYIEAKTARRGISLIYYGVVLLMPTSSVVHIMQ